MKWSKYIFRISYNKVNETIIIIHEVVTDQLVPDLKIVVFVKFVWMKLRS